MKLPAFFDDVPALRVVDPLAEMLGCAEGGVIVFVIRRVEPRRSVANSPLIDPRSQRAA